MNRGCRAPIKAKLGESTSHDVPQKHILINTIQTYKTKLLSFLIFACGLSRSCVIRRDSFIKSLLQTSLWRIRTPTFAGASATAAAGKPPMAWEACRQRSSRSGNEGWCMPLAMFVNGYYRHCRRGVPRGTARLRTFSCYFASDG